MTIHSAYEEVDMLQGRKQTVLLIESDTSLRRMISLGLQYRDMHVIESSSPASIPVLNAQLPDVIVLDIDAEVGSDHALLSIFQSHPHFSSIPLIVLTWDCLITEVNYQRSSQTSITCLAKPFDARTLQATIEQIQSTGKECNSVARQEQQLATRTVDPIPSIWPLITAAGLLLSLIGLMTQITISALGLLVLLVALLVWTLGTKPEPDPVVV